VKDSRKLFYKYKDSKSKTRENVGLLLNGAGKIVTKDVEKAKVLNAFFASVFTSEIALQQSQAPENRAKA